MSTSKKRNTAKRIKRVAKKSAANKTAKKKISKQLDRTAPAKKLKTTKAKSNIIVTENMDVRKIQEETRQKTIGATADAVSIRMYCHGFGDCFLLIFRERGTPVYYMLIDCGMLTGEAECLKAAIADIANTCGRRLDLVVQTHEHKDHISGFNQKDKQGTLLWDFIKVDQVWLAWTENTAPDGDALAITLKEKHNKKKQALARSLGLYRSFIHTPENQREIRKTFRGENYLAAQERYASALGQVLDFMDINVDDVDKNMGVSNFQFGLTMKEAMSYFVNRAKKAKAGEGPDITFWNPGDLAEQKQIGMKGIKVYFLGPPKDYARLRQMEDAQHVEMYFSEMGLSDNYYMALTGNGANTDGINSPFSSKYLWHESDISQAERAEPENVWTLYHGPKLASASDPDNSWRKIEVDWLHNAGALALHLDSYTNNTSLAMAIEFEETGQVLLFPGDAQIGNWISWTEPEKERSKESKLSWKVKRNGMTESVTAASLLERTVFYKVGHHASHNATAKKHGLELMTSKDLVAMIPVDQEVASRQGKRGWKMPAKDLYERLKQKTKGRIVRLDKGNILNDQDEILPEGSKPTKQQRDDFSAKVSHANDMLTIDGKRRPLFFEYLLEPKSS
jgi:hypothetical protein